MGATYSTTADAPVSAAPSLPGADAGAHVLKALRTMMDPNSALKDTDDESESDEKQPDLSTAEETLRPVEHTDMTDNDANSHTNAQDFAVDMDIISFKDEVEVGPVHGGASSSSSKTRQMMVRNNNRKMKKRKEEEDVIDVYMSRVAPMGLVKSLSSSSTAWEEVSDNNVKQASIGEQAV